RRDGSATSSVSPGYGGLAILLVVVILPMAWVFGYSVVYGLGGIGFLSEGWTLRHWYSALAVGGLKESLVFTPTIATAVTLVSAACSLGFVLWRPNTRHSVLALALFCIPLATPSAVAAVITYQLLNPGGFVARLAFRAGMIESPSDFPALVNDRYAIGIVLAQTVFALPLLTLFFLKTWQSARVDRYVQLAR